MLPAWTDFPWFEEIRKKKKATGHFLSANAQWMTRVLVAAKSGDDYLTKTLFFYRVAGAGFRPWSGAQALNEETSQLNLGDLRLDTVRPGRLFGEAKR